MSMLDLTPAQLDGRACIGCGRTDGAMVPAGRLEGVQLFAHYSCSLDEDVIVAAFGRLNAFHSPEGVELPSREAS